jgi:hypothetical protein
MSEPPDHLLLRFTDAVDATNVVPAAQLAAALEGFQRIIHLIGMRLEGRTLSRRARPSQEIQRRFVLVCEPPRRGSYEQPMRLSTANKQLLATDDLTRAHRELGRFLMAIGHQNEEQLEGAVPDAAYRRFMLDALAQAMPDPESGIVLDVLENGQPVINSTLARPFIEDQRRPRLSAASAGVVNGELIEIDFYTRRIKLRLLGSKKDIACSYEDSVEPTLLEHPRELIQVFGSVAVDARGIAKAIEAVEFIRPIKEDESIQISAITVGQRTLRAQPPQTAVIRFDRDEQLFYASIEGLGVEAVGETRDDVVEGVTSELRMLWRKFAEENDDRPTISAQQLKRRLLETFLEGRHAP